MSSTSDLLAGSDDSFAFLCFGFITSLLALVWVPSVLAFVWDLRSFDRFLGNMGALWAWVTYVPRTMLLVVTRPALLSIGLRSLLERRDFARRIALPAAVRTVLRPKAVLFILFCILLPIVLYQKLSFDPHEILQISKDADEKAIKKQYRKLSMVYHPDKNKTEAARVLYTRVRRAYKMLADPQAFEEEMQQQMDTYKVSVALPSFLLDPQYRRFAAPLLLGTLFLFPVALIWMLAGSDNEKAVRQAVDHLIWMQEQFNYFYQLMGEPENCTAGKPDEITAQWKVDDVSYLVADRYVQLCNDNVTRELNIIFPIIRSNKHYIHHFQQFKALHQAKQEQLAQIRTSMAAGERPSKQTVANVQAFNKRLLATVDALEPTESRMQNMDLPCCGADEDAGPGPSRKELRARGRR